jgi:hypothetical protein
VEKKISSRKKCVLSSSKVHAALKKQTGVDKNRIVNWGERSEFITKTRVHRKAKKPHLKAQHVNNPSSKPGWNSWRKTFSLQNRSTNVWWMTSRDGNEWQQQSYYESEDHPTTEDAKFIYFLSSQQRFCCGWLSVKPVFFNAGLAYPNVYQYCINVYKNTTWLSLSICNPKYRIWSQWRKKASFNRSSQFCDEYSVTLFVRLLYNFYP